MQFILSNWLPFLAAAVSAFGQILLKYAMLKHGEITFSPQGILLLLLEPRLLIALVMYATALLMWLHVLSKTSLSTAYPMLAITYILVPVLSLFCFGEKIHQFQWIGMFLILAGVAIIGQMK